MWKDRNSVLRLENRPKTERESAARTKKKKKKKKKKLNQRLPTQLNIY